MKNIINLLILSFLIILSCSKNDNDDNLSKITIKGQFTTTKSTDTSKILEATKVVVFNLNNEYTISEIKNNSFAVEINRNHPAGLIFTNDNKEFLGFLVLHNGLESIPLNFVNDSVVTIDFGILKDSLNIVKPITNLYFENFNMDEETKEAYLQASINFSIIIHNPDADRNDKIDILEGKFYTISYLYFATGGTIEQQKINAYKELKPDQYRILFSTNENNVPEKLTFKIGNKTFYSEDKKLLDGGRTIYFSDLLSSTIMGLCEITYGNKTLYFDLPNPVESLNKAVFIIPTLTFKDNNLIRVNWEYYSGSNTLVPLKNSENIIFKVMLSVDDQNHNRLYDSPNFDSYIKEHTINKTINYANIGTIYIGYYDIFGNNLAISYIKE